MYIEGRDSVTVDDMRDPILAMKNAFMGSGSIYGQVKNDFNIYQSSSNGPKSIYGQPAMQEALAYQSLGKNVEQKVALDRHHEKKVSFGAPNQESFPEYKKISTQKYMPFEEEEEVVTDLRASHQKEDLDEENKLQALNELLKSGKGAFMMKREDEEEFEQFIHNLNKPQLREVAQTPEVQTYGLPLTHDHEGHSPFNADHSNITHITGTFEPAEGASEVNDSRMQPLPKKFHIRMREQSALDYKLDDEVASIMSSVRKNNPQHDED